MNTVIKMLLLLICFTEQNLVYAVQTIMPRIVGNRSASIEDYPWMVIIGNNCSGSLISPQWVLTAAHCVASHEVKEVYWRTDYQTLELQKSTISDIIVHEGYTPTKSKDNDIALLKLDTPLNNVTPVTLLAEKSDWQSRELPNVNNVDNYTVLLW